MENVVAFNTELSGLYESKPPISKAKMAAITKAAMRAIKFYKHVVQSVEKFILKCKPEYKVPGLYVIDSIVRQSRHQFGVEKDVFAPRFARNMKETFANLFRCAPEDKSRIIRVLNLWQKNNVFAPEVIQPIFDLADPSHPIYQMQMQQTGGSAGGASASANGLNMSGGGTDAGGGVGASGGVQVNQSGGDDKLVLPDLSNNNLKQLLKDPNVLRQLQTLQNFQKFKQQEEKQHKLNELRLQEEAFEKHIQNVLKGSGCGDVSDMTGKEVEFVSEESKIEVINLDGNDSRSPTPDRDRYKRRRSRSRSRDRLAIRERRRRSRSRSRSRSPRTIRRRTSRERERERDRERLAERNRDKDKEKEREHERERRRKGLPDMKKEHLSVCSTTLWVGHLSKLVYQEELSDTFGKYGDIVSIDQIVPRGCAFIVMNRRQDATKAMSSLKNHKLQGRAITISWAAGKGVKSKEWKDFWDLELGVTYIPWDKLEEETDLDVLEEGGMFDEDTMPDWMKEKSNKLKNIKESIVGGGSGIMYGIEGMPKIDTTQPPPSAGGILPMTQFSMAPPMSAPPRLMPPIGVPMTGNMVSGIPMPPAMVAGMPPPHAMMMTPGMLPPPGYPPIPQLDKNIPPPNMRGDGQNISSMQSGSFMGNTGLMQPLPIPTPHVFQQPSNSGGNASSDDQMDIEMEDDMSTDTLSQHAPPLNFNHPPPMFQSSGVGGFTEGGGLTSGDVGGEDFASRDRNRGGSSRWGAREDRDQNRVRSSHDDISEGAEREIWRENGNNIQTVGTANFNDNSRRGGVSLPPFDISSHPQRADFFDIRHCGGDDFNDRRGGGVTRGGDFFPNMQNRFNQPNSLMQMRIQPPPVFNNRMGGPVMGSGPGMFMRGQGPRVQGGPSGGGFNFNDRLPFERDMEIGNRMRGGRGMSDRRGGGRGGGGRGGISNWRDNDDDEEGSVFKRRGGGNRFGGGRDRDVAEDSRTSRDRDRIAVGRRPINEKNSHDRLERVSRERRDGGSERPPRNRKMSSEHREEPSTPPNKVDAAAIIPLLSSSSVPLDTEEDWDQELSEHNFESGRKSPPPLRSQEVDQQENNNGLNSSGSPNDSESKEFATPLPASREEQPNKKEERTISVNTPLYDELAPNFDNKSTASDIDFECGPSSESKVDNISEDSGQINTTEAVEE